MEIIKRNQMKILDLKSTYWQQKKCTREGFKSIFEKAKEISGQ